MCISSEPFFYDGGLLALFYAHFMMASYTVYCFNGIRDFLGDLGIDRRIILKWILEKWDVKLRSRFSCDAI
jgi:hypothetical protein